MHLNTICHSVYLIDLKQRIENNTAHNSGLAKGGQRCFEETFELGSIVVLRMNFSAEFPALRQAANRCAQGGGTD